MGFTGISDENQLVVGSCIQRVAYFICAKVLTLSAALNVIHHICHSGYSEAGNCLTLVEQRLITALETPWGLGPITPASCLASNGSLR